LRSRSTFFHIERLKVHHLDPLVKRRISGF
jgi:hypothetical protein